MRVTPVNDDQRGTRDQLVMDHVGLVKLLATACLLYTSDAADE